VPEVPVPEAAASLPEALVDARMVWMTAPSEAVALALVRALVSERLAACGTLIPGARSVYRWQGAVQDEPEVLIVLKTQAELVPALTARALELHPYEVPEVLSVAVADGSCAYLRWIAESTGS